MDPFALIVLGMVVGLLLWVLFLGLYHPRSGSEVLQWQPTRSAELEIQNELDDIEQMLEAANQRRRARGEAELTEDEYRRAAGRGRSLARGGRQPLSVARVLIVGCGCRGRALGARAARRRARRARDHARPRRAAAIEAAGAEPWVGDPDRLVGSLTRALDGVTVVCWLLGSARGDADGVAALHGPRLRDVPARARRHHRARVRLRGARDGRPDRPAGGGSSRAAPSAPRGRGEIPVASCTERARAMARALATRRSRSAGGPYRASRYTRPAETPESR